MTKRAQKTSTVNSAYSGGQTSTSAGQLKGHNGKSAQQPSDGFKEQEGLLNHAGPFNEVLKDVAHIVLIKNLKGYYTFVNILTTSGLRQDMSEIIGKSDFDLFPVNIANHITRDIDRKVIKGGETIRVTEVKRIAGKIRMYEIMTTPLHGKAGAIKGLCCIIRDVTGREKVGKKNPEHGKNIEELVRKRTLELENANRRLQDEIDERNIMMQSLEESEVSFRLMAESTKHMIMRIRFTPVFKIEYVSPSAEVITGYTSEEFYADSFLNLDRLYPDDLHVFKALQTTFFTPMTLRWIRKDGKMIWCEEMSMPFCDKRGNVIGLQVVSHDVTDRMKADEELKESQEFLAAMIHNINDAIMLFYLDSVHKQGKIIEVNEAACKLLGYTRNEFLQIRPLSLYVASEEIWSPASSVMKTLYSGRRAVFESVLLAGNGSSVPVEVSAYLFEFRNRPAVVAVASTLSKRKTKK